MRVGKTRYSDASRKPETRNSAPKLARSRNGVCKQCCKKVILTLLHSGRPKLHTILAVLSAIELRTDVIVKPIVIQSLFTGN